MKTDIKLLQESSIKKLSSLWKESIFAETQCHMYSVEWQKRGLPHVHILVCLKEKIKPKQTNSFISADLPEE